MNEVRGRQERGRRQHHHHHQLPIFLGTAPVRSFTICNSFFANPRRHLSASVVEHLSAGCWRCYEFLIDFRSAALTVAAAAATDAFAEWITE